MKASLLLAIKVNVISGKRERYSRFMIAEFEVFFNYSELLRMARGNLNTAH